MSVIAATNTGPPTDRAERSPRTARGGGLRAWARQLLPRAVVEFVRPSPPPLSLHAALWRARHRGVTANGVIDVGASDGRWSAQATPFFEGAAFLLVEAQQLHAAALRQFCETHGNCAFALCAAGAHEGVVHFDASDPFGGLASDSAFEQGDTVVPVSTIDRLVEQHGLEPPYVIKLDTHGFELPILEGAARTLSQTALLIVETYNFRVAPAALTFHEMCGWLEARGFRCADIAEPRHRPNDRMLWQFDMFFMPAASPAFWRESFDDNGAIGRSNNHDK